MVIKTAADQCPLCRGKKRPGKTTFTFDPVFSVVVVRDVPATLCSQCGADWIDDEIAAKLEDIVNDARQKHHIVEDTSLSV
ncbi:MAG TPA: YgiT-type zinc finger protein [Nitrospirae bacterium]|nr:YgiT-type zinc finger protein [Nitrospirota bacterium]